MQTVKAQNCYCYNKPYTNTMYTITLTQNSIHYLNHKLIKSSPESQARR